MKEYEASIAGIAHHDYPVVLLFALLKVDEVETYEITQEMLYNYGWETVFYKYEVENKIQHIPKQIDAVYLSVVEKKFYSIECMLPVDKLCKLFQQKNFKTGTVLLKKIIIGFAPFGGIALWLGSKDKTTLVSWMKGTDVYVNIQDFFPTNKSLDSFCKSHMAYNIKCMKQKKVENTSKLLFDGFMKQFTYRYVLDIEHKNVNRNIKLNAKEIVFDYIEEALFDGTHDKLHDGDLLKYHQAGKPKKLAIKWHIGNSEYFAYFWFDDERIREVFDKFYGAHPDTKTDFIIRIDAENRKYELALYRYGLKEPQVIPENVYQLLVFKNKFEDYRSDNYNQERGAWIW